MKNPHAGQTAEGLDLPLLRAVVLQRVGDEIGNTLTESGSYFLRHSLGGANRLARTEIGQAVNTSIVSPSAPRYWSAAAAAAAVVRPAASWAGAGAGAATSLVWSPSRAVVVSAA